jgi:GNAT superfamily N-acetyltransferase
MEMMEIAAMRPEHVDSALALWHEGFRRHLGGVFPDFFPGGEAQARAFLAERIREGRALIAERGGRLIGYMAWMYFDFHGEPSAFCPTIAHAAEREGEGAICRALYTEASRRWVADGKFNHLWMFFYDDEVLKNALYELGFGSHVVDACRRTEAFTARPGGRFRISEATPGDAEALLRLANETHGYYLAAPLFLRRGRFSPEDIRKILLTQRVLLAWDEGKSVGAMGFTLEPGFDCEQLTGDLSAAVTGVGAYVLPEYRGMGAGALLVDGMLGVCAENGKPWVHACYETANPFASAFWPRYFRPAIRSVRRTVNKDANG